jgi:gluconate 2-dehydrogenase gamma chain
MSQSGVSRRSALKALGASAGAAVALPWLSDEGLLAFAEVQRKAAAPALKVLTQAQYATVEALVEAIIPTDERSPGAKDARVADYVDLLLSESDDPLKKQWAEGLALLDADATARFGAPFARLEAGKIETLLTDLARNEKLPSAPAASGDRSAETARNERPTDVAPPEKAANAGQSDRSAQQQVKTPLEAFFVTAKRATIHGYYSSEIGIHKELHYKGNQILAEFVGCHTQDAKDCPHCGQEAQA